MSVVHAAPPPPPRWVLDLNGGAVAQPAKASIPDPPGYTAPQRQQSKNTKTPQPPARKPPSTEEMDTLKLKKAWELAIAPAKQLPMNAVGASSPGESLPIRVQANDCC